MAVKSPSSGGKNCGYPSVATAVDEWSTPLLQLGAARSLEDGLRETIDFYRTRCPASERA